MQAPNLEYVQLRQRETFAQKDYFGADTTVNLVFKQWPQNNRFDEVMAKVLVLDALYSTNIYYPTDLACSIVANQIDVDLQNGNKLIVEKVASVCVNNRDFYYYSFATKFCSFHQPEKFLIYDRYVDQLLWDYQQQFHFSKFKRGELKIYLRFVEVVEDFVQHFGLQSMTLKALDKFLWIEGNERYGRSTLS